MRSLLSERVFDWLLHLYPPGFRAEYGVEMAQVFGDCYRDAQRAGRSGLVALWLATLADTTVSASKERLEEGFGMTASTLARWGGAAAMLGGVMWVWAMTVMAMRFPGVPNVAHRETGDLMPLLLAAMLLIMVGLAGLMARYRGVTSSLGRLGFALALGGSLLAPITAVLSSWVELAWLVFVVSFLAMIVGIVVLAADLLRQGAVPRAALLALALAALLLLAFNTEDARAWLGVPFGAVWVWLGALLWSGRASAYSS